MELLKNTHITPETAYVVADYPYGFRLRCKIRYWLEHHPKRGFRLMTQTTNPKRPGEVWNKPKAATYAKFGAALYLNEEGHVTWATLTEYTTGAEAKAWVEKFGEGVPEAGKALMNKWVAAKLAYDAARKPEDHLAVGLPEARKAFFETK